MYGGGKRRTALRADWAKSNSCRVLRQYCGASRLARCAGKRSAFPQLRALSGSNPGTRQQKARYRGGNGLSNSMVPPTGCPRAASPPASAAALPRLACCAGKRCAFPQLRTLPGSNPGTRQQKARYREGNGLSNSMVPPTGFEPVISTLKGWRPWPLDDGDSAVEYTRYLVCEKAIFHVNSQC